MRRICDVFAHENRENLGACLGLGVVCYLLFEAWQLMPGAPKLIPGAPETTAFRTYTLLAGLAITLALGLCSGWLLETYVTVKHPEQLKSLNFEREGGGSFLGFLERLIFFAAFWYAPLLGGAWLAFKLGAKWGTWEHLIKYPTTDSGTVMIREQLASRVLGRFLNGTLWNLVCGLIGAAVTKVLWLFLNLNL
jgi:hypothetical protein